MGFDDYYSFTQFIINLILSDDDPESDESIDLIAKILMTYFQENSTYINGRAD